MTAAAKKTFANEFWFGPVAGPLVKIAELDNIEPPQQERGIIEVTTHDSAAGAKEFISEATYDPGEVTIGGVFIANDAGDAAFDAAFADGLPRGWKIVEKGASTNRQRAGTCVLTTPYNPEGYELDGLQRFTATMKVSGAITKGAVV